MDLDEKKWGGRMLGVFEDPKSVCVLPRPLNAMLNTFDFESVAREASHWRST